MPHWLAEIGVGYEWMAGLGGPPTSILGATCTTWSSVAIVVFATALVP
jgi:hypothetical protein